MSNTLRGTGADLIALSTGLLENGVSIRFRLTGLSMHPFLTDGDYATVRPIDTRGIRIGDVILYRMAHNHPALHRVVGIEGIEQSRYVIVRGDACHTLEQVKEDDILGIVTARERNGGKERLDRGRLRLLGLVIARLSGFRRLLSPLGHLRKPLRRITARHRSDPRRYGPEDSLLIACCRTTPPAPAPSSAIDWDRFLEKARKEGIAPIVFQALPQIVDQDSVPRPVWRELRRDYYLTAAKNSIALNDLKAVLTECNREQIDVIVMKGAALAEPVYGNPALRPMSDIDLLIRKQDLHRLDRVLQSLNYAPWARTPGNITEGDGYLTALIYRKPSLRSASFHVHWHFVNSTIPNESYIGTIRIDEFRKGAKRTTISGTGAWVMAPHHLLIHLCEHALRVPHSLNKLIYFCDIAQSIDAYGTGLDWTLLMDEAKQSGIDRMVYLTLHFTRCYLQAAVPDAVLRELKPERFGFCERLFMKAVSHNCRRSGLSYLLHFSMNRGITGKARFILRTVVPPRNTLAIRNRTSPERLKRTHYWNRISEIASHFSSTLRIRRR